MNSDFGKISAILLALIIAFSTQTAWSNEDASSHEIITYTNIYNSQGKTDYGFYRFDTETFKRNLINIPGGHNLLSVKISSDGSFALGHRFYRESFINELILVDLVNKKTITLTRTLRYDAEAIRTPSASFGEFGFSLDGRFVVVTFANGIKIASGIGYPPLVCQNMSGSKDTVVFIDIRKWLITRDQTSIMKITGCDFPTFSPSGKRFFVPVDSGKSPGKKVMVYELSNNGDDGEPSPLFGYELPFCEIYQASFATDNLLYVLNEDDFLLYDLVGSRIRRLNKFIKFPMRGLGYIPEHLPVNDDFSEGPVCLGTDRFAIITSESDYLDNHFPGVNDDKSNPGKEKLIIAHGDYDSTSINWIHVPDLPDDIYSGKRLYHQLYFPPEFDDLAVLASSGKRFQAFRIIDFKTDSVSDSIPGFFMGIRNDGKGLLYFQCGENNCCRYKGSNLSWETIIISGKKVGVKSNRLYYLDIDTGVSRLLVDQPSHTSEAFFIQ